MIVGGYTIVGKRVAVLVVGGGNLEWAPDGSRVAKVPIVDYIHELSDRLGHCVWLAQDSGTWGVSLAGTTTQIKGRLDPEKVTVIGIDATVRGALNSMWLFFRYALERPYGVFFLPAFMTMLPIYPLARLFLKKNAVYVGTDWEMYLAESPKGKWLGWQTLYRASFQGSMRLADIVIARGRRLADLSRRHNANVVETVPLAHMDFSSPGIAPLPRGEEPYKILYVGLIRFDKGLGDLLEALALIRERRPNSAVVLDVLGEGPDRASLEAVALDLGIADSVNFRGWIDSPDEVGHYYSDAHALVMPTSTHPEGVPRCIDEALVRGIPVVATRIAGVPAEFSDGEVLLVDPSAPARLADGVEHILFEPEVRRQYIEGAERRRLHWSRFRSAGEQHAMLLKGESSPD